MHSPSPPRLTGDSIPFSIFTKHVQLGHGGAMLAVIDAPLNLIFAVVTLMPARFAFSNVGGVFDCPLCGGKGDLHLTVYDDNKRPNYLFNLASFCRCEPQAVADAMARRARRRRH
jgi:hypothetical protein